MTKAHSKHAKIERRQSAPYGAVEVAIHGAPCGTIQQLSQEIIQQLGQKYRLNYVDTDHRAFDKDLKPEYLISGGNSMVSDKTSYVEISSSTELNDFDRKSLFSNIDMALLNGNHHRGAEQVVILDETKTASLEKRLDRLSEVLAFIDKDGNGEVPQFFKDRFPTWGEIPMFSWHNREALIELIAGRMEDAVPGIKGLVLAGGKSQRMGRDKGNLNFHGKNQRAHASEILAAFCDDVFISCRPEQMQELATEEAPDLLPDTISGLGPYGAILSAFRSDPNSAWLVMACDLPLVDEDAVRHLLNERSPAQIATAFHNEITGFPDPLFTLWEPKAYPRLLHFLSLGYSCPRKVLINSDTKVVEPSDQRILSNVNTPADLERVKEFLAAK